MRNIDGEITLIDVLIPGAVLPRYIFSRDFNRYFFFDADIGSSNKLITTLQDVAGICFDMNFSVSVFAASNLTLMGKLEKNDNWLGQISKFNKWLRDAGDCEGLILIEASRTWIAYQKRPVDVGVFALNYIEDFQSFGVDLDDCFFTGEDIAKWLIGRSPRDIDLVKGFGSDYLTTLMKCYS